MMVGACIHSFMLSAGTRDFSFVFVEICDVASVGVVVADGARSAGYLCVRNICTRTLLHWEIYMLYPSVRDERGAGTGRERERPEQGRGTDPCFWRSKQLKEQTCDL